MIHLLIVYDLDTGRSIRMEQFDDSRTALEERFAEEAKGIPRRQIVVLSGQTIEAMKRTHSKYFTQGAPI